jgi:hypothetical protein
MEANVDDSADKKELEHEVIEGLLEELPIRGPLRGLLAVRSELSETLVQINRSDASVNVAFKLVGKCRKTYR